MAVIVEEKSRVPYDATLFKEYEDGKHRRYSLLFSVNGGAFAVVNVLDAHGTPGVGNLTLDRLALGLTLLTFVMVLDICAFGVKMRAEWKKPMRDDRKISIWEGLFALPGWFVLTAIWVLISAGWLLAGGLW